MSESLLQSIQVQLMASDRRRRVLRLTGDITAVVTYDGRGAGYERVLVDGQVACHMPNGSLRLVHLVPQLVFQISTSVGVVQASIDVVAATWWRLGGFRLVVADQVIYAEGSWCRPDVHALPVPASASSVAAEALPRAASPALDVNPTPTAESPRHIGDEGKPAPTAFLPP